MPTIDEVMKYVKYLEAGEIDLTISDGFKRPQLIGVKIILDIVGDSGMISSESIKVNLAKQYNLNDKDQIIPFGLEDLDEGIELARQFCEKIEKKFSNEDEKRLREEARKERRYTLYIIERPIYN